MDTNITEKNLSPLTDKAHCWSKRLVNFMQILCNLLKCGKYDINIKLKFLVSIFYRKKENAMKVVLSNKVSSYSNCCEGFLRP